jgi:hypothetical protein
MNMYCGRGGGEVDVAPCIPDLDIILDYLSIHLQAPAALRTGAIAPATHWLRGWFSPRAVPGAALWRREKSVAPPGNCPMRVEVSFY